MRRVVEKIRLLLWPSLLRALPQPSMLVQYVKVPSFMRAPLLLLVVRAPGLSLRLFKSLSKIAFVLDEFDFVLLDYRDGDGLPHPAGISGPPLLWVSTLD